MLRAFETICPSAIILNLLRIILDFFNYNVTASFASMGTVEECYIMFSAGVCLLESRGCHIMINASNVPDVGSS